MSSRGPTFLAELLQTERRDSRRIEALYLAAYGRKPTSAERGVAQRFIQRNGREDEAWEDLFWVLLNSAEFMSNH